MNKPQDAAAIERPPSSHRAPRPSHLFRVRLSKLYHQPDLDLAEDPRMQGPDPLDPPPCLIGEEMACEFDLHPNAIGYECFLTARLLWLNGRIPRERVADEARRFNAIADRHEQAVTMYLAVIDLL
jgi:hypothetical protein